MQKVETHGLATERRLGLTFPMSGYSMTLWGIGLLVAALMLLPIVYLLIRSISASSTQWESVLHGRTLQLLVRTLGLAVCVTVAAATIAIPLAWLTVRTDVPWRRLWATLAPLPLVIPSYVGAYLLATALGPRGLLQQSLEALFGLARLPSFYGFPGALLTLTLLSYPYLLLSVRAALLRLDPALEEASYSLGQGRWRTFWRVTLPLLRPALGVGGLLVALYTLRDFGAVALMRYDTFTRAIYMQYQSFDRSQAALLALLLVAMTLLMVMLETRLQRRVSYAQGATGALRPPPVVRLGWWRWPAWFYCATVVTVSLLLPAVILLYWLVRGLWAGESVTALGAATGNALLASGLAALVTIGAALPLGILAVRHPGWITTMLERVTYGAYALPGIVVALALVFFGANHAPWFYQTLTMLILAYAILFIPQAVGTVRTTLLQIHPSLEEVARSLGRGPGRVFLTITLPLLRPGLLAGAGMVFLTAMKELPATLLLAPLGFKTLATVVWSAVSEAFFAAAAAPALLLILLSSVPMTFFILREQTNEHDHRSL